LFLYFSMRPRRFCSPIVNPRSCGLSKSVRRQCQTCIALGLAPCSRCSSAMNSKAVTKYTTLLMNRDESAQVPPSVSRAGVPWHRSCCNHCCCSIRLIKAIRSPAMPYSGNYAAIRPTEYRIVSSNFSTPHSTIHQHACACRDSACLLSLALAVARNYGWRMGDRRRRRSVVRHRGTPSSPAVIVITSLPQPIPSNSVLILPMHPPSKLLYNVEHWQRYFIGIIILFSTHAELTLNCNNETPSIARCC